MMPLDVPPIPPGAAQCLAGPAGIPALALLTDKVTLAHAGTALEWPFVPESVSTVEAARTQLANDGPLTWLAKGAAHRAVTPSVNGADNELDGLLLLQRRIEPLLIDGRGWDLGVRPGTPAPRHPGTPAPLHPPHPGTPAPLYPCAPAPLRPCTV